MSSRKPSKEQEEAGAVFGLVFTAVLWFVFVGPSNKSELVQGQLAWGVLFTQLGVICLPMIGQVCLHIFKRYTRDLSALSDRGEIMGTLVLLIAIHLMCAVLAESFGGYSRWQLVGACVVALILSRLLLGVRHGFRLHVSALTGVVTVRALWLPWNTFVNGGQLVSRLGPPLHVSMVGMNSRLKGRLSRPGTALQVLDAYRSALISTGAIQTEAMKTGLSMVEDKWQRWTAEQEASERAALQLGQEKKRQEKQRGQEKRRQRRKGKAARTTTLEEQMRAKLRPPPADDPHAGGLALSDDDSTGGLSAADDDPKASPGEDAKEE